MLTSTIDGSSCIVYISQNVCMYSIYLVTIPFYSQDQMARREKEINEHLAAIESCLEGSSSDRIDDEYPDDEGKHVDEETVVLPKYVKALLLTDRAECIFELGDPFKGPVSDLIYILFEFLRALALRRRIGINSHYVITTNISLFLLK